MFFRNHSYANVTATLALVMALGGTSYAAVAVTGSDVKDGSLTGRDITNNSLRSSDIQGIRGWDIAAGTVKSSDIADHSIKAEDLSASALQAGAKGDDGATGAKGDTGTAGENGTAGSAVVNRTRSTGPVTPTAEATAIDMPLTDSTWTQRASEIDQLFGTANITVPASCAGMFGGSVSVKLSVDGGPATQVGSASAYSAGTIDVPITFSRGVLFEPGSAADATFTAEFRDWCSGEHMTLNSLKLDVIGTT